MPAKYEPFGLSPLEAALSGCALVLGDIESLKEIWQDSAIYVNTNDPITLAETINGLMNNPTMIRDFANKAYEQAKSYTTSSLANQYFKTYRKLVQQHHRVKAPATF